MPKKDSKAKNKSVKTNRPQWLQYRTVSPLKTVMAAIFLLLLLSIPANYLIRQYNFGQNKTKAYNSLSAIQNWFNPPGELVYNKLEDNGCGRDTSSWLGIYKACSYTLNKLYKGSGDAEASLKKSLELLADNGWVSQSYLNGEFGAVGSCEVIYSHRWGGACAYGLQDPTKPSISLEYFPRDDSRYEGTNPQQFFGIDQDIALSGDEYIYGIRVVGMYRE